MRLQEWLEQQGPGAASRLADRLGVPRVLVSQWRKGTRQVPAERCPSIERATGGMVRCEVLRPDIDWAALREDVA